MHEHQALFFLLSTISLQPKCFTTPPLVRSRVGFTYHKKEANLFFFCFASHFLRVPSALSAFTLHCSVLSVSLLTCSRVHWMNLFREAVLLFISLEAQEWAKHISKSKLNNPANKLSLLPEEKYHLIELAF